MSNTIYNLEKEIVTQLLDPIQSKYNELIKKKQDDERKVLEELAKKGEENGGLPYSPQANAESQILPPPSGEITDYETGTEPDEDEDGTWAETGTEPDEDEDGTWAETGTDIGTDNGTDNSEMGTVDDQKEQDDIWRDVEEDEAAATIQKAWRKKKQAPEETTEPESEPEPEPEPESEPEPEPEELDKSVKLTEKIKPDASKAAAALQTLLKKEQDDLASQIQEKNNTKSLMSILPLLTKKQKLQQEISDEENKAKKIEKETKKGQQKLDTDINNIDSEISEKTNIQSLVSILQLLAQKQKLEQEITKEENKIKQLKKETKKGQQKLEKDINNIDSEINEKTNVKSLLSILPLLAQKQKLEEAIQAETKEIEAHMKEQESRVKQLEKEIAVIEQNTKQHEILQKLLPILPLLAERQKIYDELNPKMTMAKMGEDLKNMFSNARGMIPSMPKMPNMCDADVSGSASRALSGLSSYLSGIYQDLFEPYNEEFTVHRPPEQLGHLDKDQIAEYKYLGKFSMDMDIGDQPLKQVAHLYFNFKDNVFHTEMELDDILAVDKEMEKQLGFDPSKYPNGAVAIIGENPEILARAIDKDDPAYQQKLQQIKQTLQQGMTNPMMPIAVAQPVDGKGTIAI